MSVWDKYRGVTGGGRVGVRPTGRLNVRGEYGQERVYKQGTSLFGREGSTGTTYDMQDYSRSYSDSNVWDTQSYLFNNFLTRAGRGQDDGATVQPLPPAPTDNDRLLGLGGGGDRDDGADARKLLALERKRIQDEAADRRRKESVERRSVYDVAIAGLSKYGLDAGEMSRVLRGLGKEAYLNSTVVREALRGTRTWASRFGGMTNMRKKKGLAYWDEGQIVRREEEFADLLDPLSINRGRVDKYARNWIGSGTSISEVKRRVTLADSWVNTQDSNTLKYMREQYGVGKRQLTGYVLDTSGKRTSAWFEEQMQEAQFGGAAKDAGFNIGRGFAKNLARHDVSRQQASQAFTSASEDVGQASFLAGLSGNRGYTRSGVSKAYLEGAGISTKQGARVKKRMASESRAEKARWGATGAGSGRGAFGGGPAAGGY